MRIGWLKVSRPQVKVRIWPDGEVQLAARVDNDQMVRALRELIARIGLEGELVPRVSPLTGKVRSIRRAPPRDTWESPETSPP